MLACSSLSVPRCCFPVLHFMWGKRWKSGVKSMLYDGWSITSHWKRCRSFFVCSCSMFQSIALKKECLMTTFLFACSELPFVDIEESRCMRLQWWSCHVPWIAKRTVFWSQNTVAIHFLMEKVCLNLFGLFRKWECIHYLDCSFVSLFS